MPLYRGKEGGRIYFQYGKSGKRYYAADYKGNQKEREALAYEAAHRQMIAIKLNGGD